MEDFETNFLSALNDYNSNNKTISLENELYASMPKDIFRDSGVEYLSLSVYCLISIVGIMANFVFCFVIWRTKKLRTVSHLLMTNLGLANLAFILLGTPIFIWKYLLKKDWVLGVVMCKLSGSALHFSATVSFYAIAVVAIDRWLSVFRPTSRIGQKASVILTVCIWIVAIGVSVPYIYFSTVSEISRQCSLDCDYKRCKFPLEIWTVVVQYVLPVLITIPAYSHLCLFLCRRREIGSGMGQRRAEARKRKVILLLILIVGSFIGCWSPYFIVFILSLSGVITLKYTVFVWLFIGAFLAVALTPLLYLANDTFRAEIIGLMQNLGCSCFGDREEIERRRNNSVELDTMPNQGRLVVQGTKSTPLINEEAVSVPEW